MTDTVPGTTPAEPRRFSIHVPKPLWIGNTRVTDRGMAHLERLSNLHDLSFANTRVTDAGLVHLKGLRSLRYLWVGSTPVTDEGVAELQRALPDLKIVR